MLAGRQEFPITLSPEQEIARLHSRFQQGLALCRALAKNSEEDNSVVEAYFQCCTDTVADRALVDLMDQVGGWVAGSHQQARPGSRQAR